MPRPTSKNQLLTEMQKEHDALETFLNTLTPAQMTRPSVTLQRSVKDVLMHLFDWEQMCLGWYQAGLRGESPPLPALGFKWNQIPALNEQLYQKHRDQPLAEAMQDFRASYRQIRETLQAITEEDLFTPGRYAWTKKLALAAYFISATSSHYVWARKEVKKCLKG